MRTLFLIAIALILCVDAQDPPVQRTPTQEPPSPESTTDNAPASTNTSPWITQDPDYLAAILWSE